MIGVEVATVDVTTGTERKLEQNAVAAARDAESAALVPVGLKHRARLSPLTARAAKPTAYGSSLATGLDNEPKARERKTARRKIEVMLTIGNIYS